MKDMKYTVDSKTAGTSFLELLTLVFIVLKLTKVITWSWWVVLSPIWGTLIVAVIMATIIVVLQNKNKI